jgi:hypothetical protein
MSIEIRHDTSAAEGPFTYSVQRRADGMYFDFMQGQFFPPRFIAAGNDVSPLTITDGIAAVDFRHMEFGVGYLIRIHDLGQRGMVIRTIPMDGDADTELSRPMTIGYGAQAIGDLRKDLGVLLTEVGSLQRAVRSLQNDITYIRSRIS